MQGNEEARNLNKTVAESNSSSINKNVEVDHFTALKQSVLDSFQHMRESEMNNQLKSKLFFYEALAMFILTYGWICAQASPEKEDGLYAASALLAVICSARLSGSNINPAITLANVIRKENKYQKRMLAIYLGAQLVGAFLALMFAQSVHSFQLPYPHLQKVKDSSLFVSGIRVVISQIVGTFILIFFILQISNPNTTFIDNELSGFMFIMAFIHISRKFAPFSKFPEAQSCVIVNAAITFMLGVVGAVNGNYQALGYCWLWIAGDAIGTVLATIMYDRFFQPNVDLVRGMKRKSEHENIQYLIDSHINSPLSNRHTNSVTSSEISTGVQKQEKKSPIRQREMESDDDDEQMKDQ